MEEQLKKVITFLEELNRQTMIVPQKEIDEHYENIEEHRKSSEDLDEIINDLSAINHNDSVDANHSLFNIYLSITDYAWYFSEISDLTKWYLKEYEKKQHVVDMDEFFLTPFGKSIAPYLSKSTSMENGNYIYQVMETIDSYLLQTYGVFLSEHKNYLEIADHTGEIKYVLNFDGTINIEETRNQAGRVANVGDNEWRAYSNDWGSPNE